MRLSLLLLSLLISTSAQSSSLQSELDKIGQEFERAIKQIFEAVKERANATGGSPIPYSNSTDQFRAKIDRFFGNLTRNVRSINSTENRGGVFYPYGGFVNMTNPFATTTPEPTFIEKFFERLFGKVNKTRSKRSTEESDEESSGEETTRAIRHTKGPRGTGKPHGTERPQGSEGPRGTGRPSVTGRPSGSAKPSGSRGPSFGSSRRPNGHSTVRYVTGKPRIVRGTTTQ